MKAAMLQVVKDGHMITWPGLTKYDMSNQLKLPPDIAMGYMH
jgi:hypothetical protein